MADDIITDIITDIEQKRSWHHIRYNIPIHDVKLLDEIDDWLAENTPKNVWFGYTISFFGTEADKLVFKLTFPLDYIS
jgi:hypothetical protein